MNQLYFYWNVIRKFTSIQLIPSSMSSSPYEVKIQEESLKLLLLPPGDGELHHPREGNSHIYAKTGHWSDQEKLRYLMFIDHYQDKLQTKEKRRLWKIFKAMSTFLKTRKPNQCRSHHQKMQSYFQSTSAIIAYFKDRIPHYREQYELSLPELERIEFGLPLPDPFVYNQEESISNNEFIKKMELGQGISKLRGRRTSIKIADQEVSYDFKDKNLPGTDISLHSFPSENHQNQADRIREHVSRSFINNDFLHYQMPFHFSLPSFPLISLKDYNTDQVKQTQMTNFFEYYQQRACNQIELNEWIECERLYLLWRNTFESLNRVNH